MLCTKFVASHLVYLYCEGDFMVSVVIGGYRNFEKYEIFKSFVDSCLVELDLKEITIHSGHCKGVDLMGEQYAKEKGLLLEVYPAEWKKYGKAAGPIRNKQMVEKADIVIAFVCERAKGTKNLIAQAKKLDKKVFVKEIGEFI